jgi:hypothetical protein
MYNWSMLIQMLKKEQKQAVLHVCGVSKSNQIFGNKWLAVQMSMLAKTLGVTSPLFWTAGAILSYSFKALCQQGHKYTKLSGILRISCILNRYYIEDIPVTL